MKADLHNHLGKNGKNPGFDETIKIVYEKMGANFVFGVVNCTSVDHRFEDFTNQAGKYERVWLDEEKRIMSVPELQIYVMGIEEVISREGHFIVAGMPSNKKIQKYTTTLFLEDALKSADDFNGIKIIAHPFSKDGLGQYIYRNRPHFFPDRKLLERLDGWEVYNASAELAIPGILPLGANEDSVKFYKEFLKKDYNIGACAFTDGHSVEVIGRSYMDLNLESNFSLESLKHAIKSNKTFDNLYMEPAKWDALKHAYNLISHKFFKSGA